MPHSEKDLSDYRLERAKEDIQTAKINIDNGLYKGAVNRSYYAIFHAIRAVNVLDGFDASKHSSVIAHLISIMCIRVILKKEHIRSLILHIVYVRSVIIQIFLLYQKKMQWINTKRLLNL